jgi:hypothetical protein
MIDPSSVIAFQRGALRRMRVDIQGASELVVGDTLPKNPPIKVLERLLRAELGAMR